MAIFLVLILLESNNTFSNLKRKSSGGELASIYTYCVFLVRIIFEHIE
jgi:hypothetical protein